MHFHRMVFICTLFLAGPAWALAPKTVLRHPFEFNETKLISRIQQIDRRLTIFAREQGFDWRVDSADRLIPKLFPLIQSRELLRLGDADNFFLKPDFRDEPVIVLRAGRLRTNFQLWPEFELPVLSQGELPSRLFGSIYYQVYPSLNAIEDLLALAPQTRRTLALHYFVKSFGINPNWVTPGFQPIIDAGVFPDRKKYLRKQDNDELEFHAARLLKEKKSNGSFPNFDEDLVRRPRPNVLLETQVYAMLFHELFHDVFFTRIIGPEGRKEFEQLLFHSEDPEVRNYMDEFESIGGVKLIPALFNGKGAVKAVAVSEVFARFAAIYREQAFKKGDLQSVRDESPLTSVFHGDTDFNARSLPLKFRQFFNRYDLLLLQSASSKNNTGRSLDSSL